MSKNSQAIIHYQLRPGSQRPLCNAPGVAARHVTSYKAAVTCAACAAKMPGS